MTQEHAVVVGGVSYGRMLPRGPYALPQEVVHANQRERILKAATTAVVEKGFASLTVSEVIERAGVSRRSFYELFEDKLDCVLLAHDTAFDHLVQAIVGACQSKADWPEGVAAAVGAALEFASGSPDEARLVLDSNHTGAEPGLAQRGLAAQGYFAALLRVARSGSNGSAAPALTEQAVVGAAMSVVGARLFSGEAAGLPALAPELVQLILLPYLGETEARRVAQLS